MQLRSPRKTRDSVASEVLRSHCREILPRRHRRIHGPIRLHRSEMGRHHARPCRRQPRWHSGSRKSLPEIPVIQCRDCRPGRRAMPTRHLNPTAIHSSLRPSPGPTFRIRMNHFDLASLACRRSRNCRRALPRPPASGKQPRYRDCRAPPPAARSRRRPSRRRMRRLSPWQTRNSRPRWHRPRALHPSLNLNRRWGAHRGSCLWSRTSLRTRRNLQNPPMVTNLLLPSLVHHSPQSTCHHMPPCTEKQRSHLGTLRSRCLTSIPPNLRTSWGRRRLRRSPRDSPRREPPNCCLFDLQAMTGPAGLPTHWGPISKSRMHGRCLKAMLGRLPSRAPSSP